MRYRDRRKRTHRLKVAATILALLAIAGIGMTLNWIAYSAWICEEVPNHYSCE